jgi:vancomycin permeability regulator SanA
MFWQIRQKVWCLVKQVVVLGIAAVLLPRAVTTLHAQSRLTTVAEAGKTQVAIIYGAEVHRYGRPSAVLRDRLDAGIELYRAGKVDVLLMSGHAPEPEVMRTYAVQAGVLPEDIWLDNGGLRTYDTCYRAANVFQLEEAILVTQAFHLPRSLYLCSRMGLEVQGVAAQESRYWQGAKTYWQIRETLATSLALWEVHVTKPVPTISGWEFPREGSW